MDKKITLLLLFLLSVVSSTKAQTYAIRGRLISGKQIVDYANIILQKPDSDFVTSVMSDKYGRFNMNEVKEGDYRLVISCIGFNDKKIDLKLQNRNADLGDIELDSMTHQLKEVVVQGAKVIRAQDKQVALPTKFQLKASTNGVDLLKSMQLSRLHVDIINNKISSSAQGEVQTRINGAKVNIQQIQALRPEDIQRVEYHDNPGMQYGQGVACVIDYITKHPISGGNLSLDLAHSPFDGWFQDHLSGSYNKGKSQFGVYAWGMYRNLHQWRDNRETFNQADGSSFIRTEDGHPDKLKMNNFYGNIYYNYKEGDKWYFNTTLHLSTNASTINNNSTLFPINDKSNYVNMLDLNKNTATRPWLDIYFQRNFGKRRTLIFNAVGTYIHNHVERKYTEDKGADILTDINSTTNGDKYSVIAEAIYSVGLTKKSNLSFGFSGSQAYTCNDYTGTITTATNMHDGYARGFAEWKQTLGNFNYSFGSFLSYVWMLQGTNELKKMEWYPKMSLGYTFNDHSYLRLTGERSYTTPSLGDISNVEQVIDSLQIRRGNPDLKVSHTWMTNMYYEYRKNKFTLGLNVYYQYQQKPVMEETLLENDKFIRTIDNQKSWQQFTPELQLQMGPLFNLFTVNVTGGMNYFDSHGLDYHHKYTNWYYTAEVILQHKNLTLMLEGQNHRNFFYGETSQSGESLMIVMARYRIKRASLGLTIVNPFSSRESYNLPTVNYSKYAPSYQAMHVRESARLIAVTFNWNFSFGRKYESGQKQLNIEDKDSGAMKSGK
jgi:hypothetical protein